MLSEYPYHIDKLRSSTQHAEDKQTQDLQIDVNNFLVIISTPTYNSDGRISISAYSTNIWMFGVTVTLIQQRSVIINSNATAIKVVNSELLS